MTFLAGALLLDPQSYAGLGESAVATVLFFSNILFLGQSGYFAAPSLQKPLLHTWSLSVEEQFYIVFPIFLSFVKKYGKGRYVVSVLIFLVVSFLVNVLLIERYPKETFFYMHSRAWELLFGSVVALCHVRLSCSFRGNKWLSLFGFVLIVYAVCLYDESLVYSGYYALLPVIGAAMMIFTEPDNVFSVLRRFLESKIMVFIGRISYSLYLWHWVIIVYYRYWVNRSLFPYEKVMLVLVPIILAYFLWRFVEKPFRVQGGIIHERRRLFVYSAIVMFVLSAVGVSVCLSKGFPKRLDIGVDAETVTRVRDEHAWKFRLKNGILGASEVSPSFVLWGDSHAEALAPAVHQMAEKYGFSGYIRVDGGAPPILGVERSKIGYDLIKRNNDVISFIASHPEVEYVFLACNYNGYKDNNRYSVNGERADAEKLSVAIQSTVRVLTGMQKKVVFITQCPRIDNEPLKLLWISVLKGSDYRDQLPSFASYRESVRWMDDLLGVLSAENDVYVIDIYKDLFDDHGSVRIVEGKNLIYSDAGHLSVSGARYLAPLLDGVFREMTEDER